MRARTLAILDGTDPVVGRRVALAINVLIILSAIVVALETVPALKGPFGRAFLVFEVFVVAVFGIEYVVRVWASPRRWGISSACPASSTFSLSCRAFCSSAPTGRHCGRSVSSGCSVS